MFINKELPPIKVIDDEYKLKEYMKRNGLFSIVSKIPCECNKERDIYLLIQTPYIIDSVVVCKECYDNNKYPKLKT
jgi:hypothetical protein